MWLLWDQQKMNVSKWLFAEYEPFVESYHWILDIFQRLQLLCIFKRKMFSWWFFKYILNLLFLINVVPSTNSCSDDDTTCDYYSSDATSSTSWWFLWKNIGKDNEYFFIQNCLIIPKPSNSFFLYLIFIILERSEYFWLVLLLHRKYLCLEKWWMHYVVSVNNLLTID